MIYVIPQIMPMITEMTNDIPWTTESLIWVSDFMKNNVLYIIGFIVAWALIFYAYVSTPNGRKWIDTVKMQFPIVGKVYKNYMVVQVMDTF
jgi:type IV pilus assembly protein PilC